MATRSLNVQITGDAKQLGVASKQADGHMDKLGKSGVKMGKMMAGGFALAGAAAGGALVLGLKKSVDAAKDAEASMAKVKTIVDNAGISFDKHAKQIDKVIQAHSKLTGFDDEELSESFANMVRTTGKLNEAYKLNALAADIARAKGTDLAGAQSLLARVYNGSYTGVKRLGIAIEPVTKAQDALKKSTKNATDEQVKAAKAADKQATSQAAIAKLQKAFGGQAEAYGKTAAGAQERLGVAIENLQEKIGAKLLPVITKVTNKVADFVGQMESGKGAGGRFAAAVTEVVSKIGGVVAKVREFGVHIREMFSGGDKSATSSFGNIVSTVRKNVTAIIAFVRDLAARIKTTFSGITDDLSDIGRAWLKVQSVILGVAGYIGRKILPGLSQTIGGLASVIRGVIKIVAGLLSGDFKKAWEGAKTVVDGVFNALKGTIRGAWDALGPLMVSLAKFLIRKLGEGLKALPGALKDAIVGAIKWAAENVPGLVVGMLKGLGKSMWNNLKDGFAGKLPFGLSGDGIGFIAGGGGGTASLMGADSDLFPIVQTAGRFGLHTSSGLRPGAITSSGNPSFHGSGDAVDESGPPGAMLKFFNYMKSTAGPKLRELIYTPGGVGIKDGRPFRYTGQVAADHFDHVHVAYTGPFGDGIGDIRNLWTREGGSAAQANMAAAIAMAESGGNPSITHRNSDGSIDRGLWQINSVHGALSTINRAGNARAAIKISGNGRNWNPWTVFKTGAYKRFLSGSSDGGSGGSSKPKTQTVTSNPTKGYDAAAMYNSDRPETRTVTLSDGSKVRFPVTDSGPFRPWSPKGIKGLPEDMQPQVRPLADVRGEGGGIDSLIAALKANTDALEEQRKQYETLIAEDYRAKYNVSQSQYGILAQAIADVANGGIGQRLGLGLSGLRAPAGSVARA